MIKEAVFYKATDEFNTYEKHVPAPYLRHEFASEPGKRYRLTVSGLGFYRLFINGTEVTKGLLAPNISSPDDIVYFDAYDVTDLVTPDGNTAVGMLLGNGMQNAPGGRVWDFDKAPFRAAPCFAALLTVTDADGNETTEDIGGLFKTAPSPILFDDLRSGCFYDANKELAGWDKPGFDDGAWADVKRADNPRGERRMCDTDPIVITEEIRPVLVRKTVMDGEFDNRENMRLDTEEKLRARGQEGVLFDFGINTTGLVRLKVDGRKGQRIFIQFCELMTTAGYPSYKNTGNFYPDGYGQTVLYICKGEKDETFVPGFCYLGFRYAVAFGLDDAQISEDTLTLLRANSDLKTRGGFSCDSDVMNKLGGMVHVSDLSNFWYFPTDCPHREKNGWTGDAAVSAEHMLLTLTPERSYREWLRSVCKAQRDDGALPGIVPTGGWGFDWGNGPAWDNVLSELCWQIYRIRGDLTPARECSDSLMRYMNYLAKLRDENGLIGYGLGDWLQPGRGAGDPVAPVLLTSSVIGMYIARKSATLFHRIGLTLQASFAKTLRDELKSAIRRHFIDFSSMTVAPRCQTAQAICLYYGVFNDDEKAAAGKVLETLIHEKDDHFDCGMIGMRVIFHVLSDLGLGDLAFKMITRDDYPSYGMFVRRGMTSLPESFKPDEDDDNPDSLNHHFMGDIVSWFIQKVAGLCVNPANNDPDSVLVRPDFLNALGRAEAYYEAPAGRIEVRWQKTDGGVCLTVDAAEGVHGDIRLPAGYALADGAVTFKLASGEYQCVRQN